MENSSTYAKPDANLRTVAEKIALGWDFDSLEQRMTVRLAKVRRQNQGEGTEGKTTPRFADKEYLRN